MKMTILPATIALSLAFVLSSSLTKACEVPLVASGNLSKKDSVGLRVSACPAGKDEYDVGVELLVGGRIVQTETISADGAAYYPAINTAIDLDGDGLDDVGISNGKGRAGDGMSYWLFRSHPYRLISAGEGPTLAWSGYAQHVLFALVPGSGDVQATRIEYKIDNEHLAMTRAIQFRPLPEKRYELTEVPPENQGKQASATFKKLYVDEELAHKCMAGTKCPSF